MSLRRSGRRLGGRYSSYTAIRTSFLASVVSCLIPSADLRLNHFVPAGIPLCEQDEGAMPDEPQERGAEHPAPAPVREDQEPQKEVHGGPGMTPEAQRTKRGDALPDAAQNGRRIAMKRRSLLRHYSVAPAARPSVPSMAVPPPRIPRGVIAKALYP